MGQKAPNLATTGDLAEVTFKKGQSTETSPRWWRFQFQNGIFTPKFGQDLKWWWWFLFGEDEPNLTCAHFSNMGWLKTATKPPSSHQGLYEGSHLFHLLWWQGWSWETQPLVQRVGPLEKSEYLPWKLTARYQKWMVGLEDVSNFRSVANYMGKYPC